MLSATAPRNALYRKTLNRMGWSMLLFIGLFYFFTFISEICQSIILDAASELHPIWSAIMTAGGGLFAAVCYMAPFFLTGAFFYLFSRHTQTERILLEPRLPREFPLWILAGMAVLTAGAYINSWFCSLIGYSMPENMVVAENYDRPAVIILYMTVSLAPAFAEEFLFRGVFYTNLRPFGRTQAILISAFLFALMHQNIAQLFYTFVAGIAMALMYEITGSIWCGVFFHMFNNQFSVISEVLYYGRLGEAATPYLSIFDAIQFILGAVSLILLILFYKKKQSNDPGENTTEIWGSTKESAGRRERSLSASDVWRGMLNPGMMIFTVVTCILMGLTWVLLIAISAGGV